tara:strand:+ start:2018 stop:2752 length:735 start_codon:yes stop_codon:yes gene_type:complete
MKKIVISISPERLQSLDYDYILIKGCKYEEVPEYIQDNFLLKPNERLDNAKGKIGCFGAHMKVLEYIKENKIDDVAVLEDDAHIDREQFPPEFNFPQDGACLLNGVFHHPTNWSKDKKFIKEELPKIIQNFKQGVNKIDYEKYRFTGTFAIYYPNHRVASEILEKIKKGSKYKHLDLYLGERRLIKYFHYPSLYTHNDCIDENREPTKAKSLVGLGDGIIRNYVYLGKTKKIVRENTPPRINTL